jgi:hypothetical protein
MKLEAYEFVILRSAPSRRDLDEQTGDRLQRDHLAFLAAQREAGLAVATGPLREQADQSMRGLVIYRTGRSRRRAGSAARTRWSRPVSWRPT